MARVAERRDGEVMTDRKTPTWPVITTDHPVCQVVDLRRTFRTQFRYEWDEVFQAESPAGRKQEAAHLTIIPGEFGSVSPHGGPLLVAYCPAGAVKRRQLEDLACVQILHGGGKDCDEVMGLFAQPENPPRVFARRAVQASGPSGPGSADEKEAEID